MTEGCFGVVLFLVYVIEPEQGNATFVVSQKQSLHFNILLGSIILYSSCLWMFCLVQVYHLVNVQCHPQIGLTKETNTQYIVYMN